VQGRRHQRSSRQCKSPPTTLIMLSCRAVATWRNERPPVFQLSPGLPRFRLRSSGILSTIFPKSLIRYLTLSPQGQRPRSKPNSVDFTVITVNRHLPSMSFYESHRRQPSITRYRSNKRKSGMKTLDGQAAQRLHLSLPLNPHRGRIIDREQGSTSLEPQCVRAEG
jgi:hypothetical protein